MPSFNEIGNRHAFCALISSRITISSTGSRRAAPDAQRLHDFLLLAKGRNQVEVDNEKGDWRNYESRHY